MTPTPEQRARQDIDAVLEEAGWIIQDRATMNLAAGPGVAVREFKMASGHGFADYLLFVHGKAVGVLEAKPAGYALSNVELQADKYATEPDLDPILEKTSQFETSGAAPCAPPGQAARPREPLCDEDSRGRFNSGGGTRTHDPLINSQML